MDPNYIRRQKENWERNLARNSNAPVQQTQQQQTNTLQPTTTTTPAINIRAFVPPIPPHSESSRPTSEPIIDLDEEIRKAEQIKKDEEFARQLQMEENARMQQQQQQQQQRSPPTQQIPTNLSARQPAPRNTTGAAPPILEISDDDPMIIDEPLRSITHTGNGHLPLRTVPPPQQPHPHPHPQPSQQQQRFFLPQRPVQPQRSASLASQQPPRTLQTQTYTQPRAQPDTSHDEEIARQLQETMYEEEDGHTGDSNVGGNNVLRQRRYPTRNTTRTAVNNRELQDNHHRSLYGLLRDMGVHDNAGMEQFFGRPNHAFRIPHGLGGYDSAEDDESLGGDPFGHFNNPVALNIPQFFQRLQVYPRGRAYASNGGGLAFVGGLGGNDEELTYERLLELGERLGYAHKGADANTISQNTSKYKIDDVSKLKENKNCTVCLSDFETGEEVRTLPCLHTFHAECIDKWLQSNKTCPICKAAIDEHNITQQT